MANTPECAFCFKATRYTYHIHNAIKYWFCTLDHYDRWSRLHKKFDIRQNIDEDNKVFSKNCHGCLVPLNHREIVRYHNNLVYNFCSFGCRDKFVLAHAKYDTES